MGGQYLFELCVLAARSSPGYCGWISPVAKEGLKLSGAPSAFCLKVSVFQISDFALCDHQRHGRAPRTVLIRTAEAAHPHGIDRAWREIQDDDALGGGPDAGILAPKMEQ
jgi:hypothetical protein